MVTSGEVFAIAAMFGGASVLIVLIDFLERNLPDAIGDDSPWGDVVNLPVEMKAAAEKRGGGAQETQRPSHSIHPLSHQGQRTFNR
jgi:hypothetical protein